MLSITIQDLGKKFNREWIFRELSYEISPGEKVVILGGNGSGKSTLLQVISGFITPNEGKITYRLSKKDTEEINDETLKDHVSFASPYLQLIDDLTLGEMVDHCRDFKPYLNALSTEEIISIIELDHAKNKFIKQYSSGMKQRLKLGLAILADTPLLLLDEPVSNLDKNAIDWYKQMVNTYAKLRTVIVCSNAMKDEYFFCERELDVAGFKPAVRT